GGDGYVAARYLCRRGAAVEVRSLGEPQGEDSPARSAALAAARAGVSMQPLGSPEPADLVIDALFGAGFRGELPDPVVPWAETPTAVVAVDVPSGLDATDGAVSGASFRARKTVTFHALKVGHLIGEGPDRCGEVEVADIGLRGGTPELWLCEEEDAPLPGRRRVAHKWSAGSVLVAGGSIGISGSAMLTARSALNAGAGAVLLACPGGLQAIYSAMSPEVMTRGVGSGDHFEADGAAEVLEIGERFDVLAVGPGLGRGREDFVGAIIEGRAGALVIDADGINALSGPELLAKRPGPTVITPHHGEFRRLTGAAPGYAEAGQLAEQTGATVLLKGNPTFVMGQAPWVVTSGGPELATIGTGDVLTGLVAALWARGLEGEAAARSAAYWHGVAGRSLAGRTTVTAEGLVEEVGRWAR
ncbi:MAG: NAD(P)H-hydrate dehydratase, partial [Acidimicrobiia bacterium]